MATRTRKRPDRNAVSFDPLPIHDAIDERALNVYIALRDAWRIRQDRTASARERERATGLVNRLWGAAHLAGRGSRSRVLKELVLLFSEDLREVADAALAEYRHEVTHQARGMATVRKTPKARAIEVILNHLAPSTRSEGAAQQRESLKKQLEQWRWAGGRRVDGLTRDLTALRYGIAPGSVRVLKHRARRRIEAARTGKAIPRARRSGGP